MCQNLIFNRTYEEEHGTNFASSFFTFHIANIIAQILIGHVTAHRVYVVVLTNMQSI